MGWLAAKKILSVVDFTRQRKAQFIAYLMMSINASNRFSINAVGCRNGILRSKIIREKIDHKQCHYGRPTSANLFEEVRTTSFLGGSLMR